MNRVYAVIGLPAAGKTTLVKLLNKDFGIPALISHTTRAPKPDEAHGVDYFFVDKDVFAATAMLEKAVYSGNAYGLSKDEVMNKVNRCPISVVDIDLAGYGQLKKVLGERLQSIFLLVDWDTVLERCALQGESQENIRKRIEYAQAHGEIDHWQSADYAVKNTQPIETTLRQVLAIMGLCVPQKPQG